MIQIRPVSDLRNKFLDIEKAVGSREPLYLTKMNTELWWFSVWRHTPS